MTRQQLKGLIKEVVSKQLNEMARIATMIKVADPKAAQAAALHYQGTWVADMIKAVQAAGENGIAQPDLAVASGKTRQQDINSWVRKFIENDIFVYGQLAQPIKPKPVAGNLGRPKTPRVAAMEALFAKFKENPEYAPTPEEIALIGDVAVGTIKARALGTLRKGRPLGTTRTGVDDDMNDNDIDDPQ